MPEKLLIEKKKVILMGDYNTNILNCNTEISNSIDAMYVSCFYLTFSTSTIITVISKRLIDNIFYNTFTKNTWADNIVTSILLYQITVLSLQ